MCVSANGSEAGDSCNTQGEAQDSGLDKAVGTAFTEEELLLWTPSDGLAQPHLNGGYSSLGTGGIC